MQCRLQSLRLQTSEMDHRKHTFAFINIILLVGNSKCKIKSSPATKHQENYPLGLACIEKQGEALCSGQSIRSFNVVSKEICASKCYNKAECVAWTFSTSPPGWNNQQIPWVQPNSLKTCWLKRTADCTKAHLCVGNSVGHIGNPMCGQQRQ